MGRYADFVNAPLKEHGQWIPTIRIPGIAERAEAALAREGYTRAFHVVGQYLVSDMCEEVFKQWLSDVMDKSGTQLSAMHVDWCYRGVRDWCVNNM